MGVQPNLPIKLSIDTMLDFDSDFDGHGDGDVSCKQTLRTFLHSASTYSLSISQNQRAQNASRVKFTPIYKRNKTKERGCNFRHGHLYENKTFQVSNLSSSVSVKSICKMMGMQALHNGRLGSALSWGLRSKDVSFVTVLAEK